MTHGRADVAVGRLREESTVVQTLCELIDTPRSLAVSILLQEGSSESFKQLLDLKVNPQYYQSVSDFADDYLVTEVLKKSASLPTGIDLEAAATAKFYEAEKLCWETNHRLTVEDHPQWWSRFTHIVKKILGPLGSKDLDDLPGLFKTGPGATTSVRGTGSVPSEKYDGEIHLTPNLMSFARLIQGELWWNETPSNPRCVVRGNRFTTVPKNAKTNRGICIEPDLNIFVQLGIGKLLRRKLRRYGLDLNHQQIENRRLASLAHKLNLATIDLSMASDTVADVLVQQVLPPRWSHLLHLARSPETKVDGEWVKLEKHSSMGNGYTFELETTIFLALVHAIVPEEEHELCAVFGDDIILPQAYAPMLVEALNYCGFKVNGEKSFLAGNFFESCGEDFFHGVNVRPFYLRRMQDNPAPYPVQIANKLRLYATKRGVGGCDARFKDLWESCVNRAPKSWQACRVPPHLGDVGVICSKEEVKSPPRSFASDGWLDGKCHLVMMTHPRERRGNPRSYYLVMLAQAGSGETIFRDGRESVRGFLRRPVRSLTRSIWPVGLSWQ